MANVYLEKIAAMKDIGQVVGAGARFVGRAAAKGATAVGRQAHLATGGGYRDYAHGQGFKNLYKRIDMSSEKTLRKGLMDRVLKDTGSKDLAKTVGRNFEKNVAPGLKKQQTAARIRLGAGAAGATYAGVKINDKLNEPQVQTYNYY